MEKVIEKHSTSRRRVASKPETVAAFEKWEARQSGDYNYEFYYGEIIKKFGMKQLEMFLVKFLISCFKLTQAEEEGGYLFQEIDIYVDEQRKRIADLAFFNQQQILSSANGTTEVPSFAIELLSPSETFREIEVKLKDYFDAGVQLVWYISPTSKKIYAYTPQNKVQVFAAGDIAVAEPVLPDFKVEVDKLFTPA